VAGEPPRWRRLAGSSKINFFFKYLYQPLPLLLLFHILTLIFEKDLQKRLDLAFYGSEFFYLFSLKWRRMLLVVWVSTQTQVLSLLPHQNDSEPPLLFLVLVRKKELLMMNSRDFSLYVMLEKMKMGVVVVMFCVVVVRF